MNVRGASSFDQLKTVNGTIHETFADAARELNLVEDDQEWTRCLEEASQTHMPFEMRNLFVSILIHCGPNQPVELWESFRDAMAEDFIHKFRNVPISMQDAHNLALVEIHKSLQMHNASLLGFGINLPTEVPIQFQTTEVNVRECIFDRNEERTKLSAVEPTLNEEQRVVFNMARESLDHSNQLLLFVDGPGGSGKTYVLKAICNLFRSRGETIIPSAWTGDYFI